MIDQITKEFGEKFDHFNDSKTSKRICNSDCEENYDLNDIESFLHTALERAYFAGFDAGGQTKGGTGRIMYQRGLAEGRKETVEEVLKALPEKDIVEGVRDGWNDCLAEVRERIGGLLGKKER